MSRQFREIQIFPMKIVDIGRAEPLNYHRQVNGGEKPDYFAVTVHDHFEDSGEIVEVLEVEPIHDYEDAALLADLLAKIYPDGEIEDHYWGEHEA